MKGIINCFKPRGITSFDVIRVLRKTFSLKKMGHSGTLDPMAEGVLPVFIGKATKLIEYQKYLSKRYRAEMILGIKTDTQDITGKIMEKKKPVNIDREKILEVFGRFTGNIRQIPPMYSAIKHKGEKLYNLARKGLEVERKEREVEIYELSFLDFINNDFPGVLFEVECSPGTYIRTLCEDMGLALDCWGCLNSLLRLKSGSFEIADSFTPEEISSCYKKGHLNKILHQPSFSVSHLASVVVIEEFEKKVLNGNKVYLGEIQGRSDGLLTGEVVCIYNSKNELIATGKISEEYLEPLKIIAG